MKYVVDELASFKVKHAVDGVSVTMNSTLIEAYFKKYSKIEESPYELEWDGHMPYNVPQIIGRHFMNCLQGWRASSLYFSSTTPNMSFLRCEGLKDGIDVIIKMPCSEAYLERYAKLLGKKILQFYYEEIEPKYNPQVKTIPSRYRDIYRYVEFRGYTMDKISTRKLGYLMDCLTTQLKALNISKSEIQRRINNHVS